jgi:hypothetical protein
MNTRKEREDAICQYLRENKYASSVEIREFLGMQATSEYLVSELKRMTDRGLIKVAKAPNKQYYNTFFLPETKEPAVEELRKNPNGRWTHIAHDREVEYSRLKILRKKQHFRRFFD